MSFSLFALEDHPLIKPISSLGVGWHPLRSNFVDSSTWLPPATATPLPSSAPAADADASTPPDAAPTPPAAVATQGQPGGDRPSEDDGNLQLGWAEAVGGGPGEMAAAARASYAAVATRHAAAATPCAATPATEATSPLLRDAAAPASTQSATETHRMYPLRLPPPDTDLNQPPRPPCSLADQQHSAAVAVGVAPAAPTAAAAAATATAPHPTSQVSLFLPPPTLPCGGAGGAMVCDDSRVRFAPDRCDDDHDHDDDHAPIMTAANGRRNGPEKPPARL
eukprot:COSAG01_NODE_199_length_22202_cov_23.993668_13_plen_279_part_00